MASRALAGHAGRLRRRALSGLLCRPVSLDLLTFRISVSLSVLEYEPMTTHETLWVLKAVHDHVVGNVSNPGPWCWPTFELLSSNIRANRHLLHVPGWRSRLAEAEARGWVVRQPCTPHCHARHVVLSAAGEAVLARMNAQGCDRNCACRTPEADRGSCRGLREVRLARRVEKVRRAS
jgi:hypothetical protein